MIKKRSLVTWLWPLVSPERLVVLKGRNYFFHCER